MHQLARLEERSAATWYRIMRNLTDSDLSRNAANFASLSPLGFIARTGEIYPERLAIVHGGQEGWLGVVAGCLGVLSPMIEITDAFTTHPTDSKMKSNICQLIKRLVRTKV